MTSIIKRGRYYWIDYYHDGKLAGALWHFHLLRHRFASDLLERGVDVVTIAAILGHAIPSTTLIYSHTSRERKWAAVDKLDQGTYIKNNEILK